MRINNLILVASAVLFVIGGCNPQAKNLMTTTELNSNWTFRQVGESEWLPATVPGTVHTDLLNNGKIEDPYYRLNERDVQWIDKVDWEYKTNFAADEKLLSRDKIQLGFKGLDTYADVFVNDKPVLSADNMFREWTADVKEFLKEGENELRIVFRSPIVEGIKKYDAQGFEIPVSDNDLAEIGQVEGGKKVSVYSRKAGYHFGWDWGPRLVTSGIWRPVLLQAWDEATIENLQIVQNSVSDSTASLTAVFEINALENETAILSVLNDGVELAQASVELTEGTVKYPVSFEIANPKLWWTNGLGEQHLYTFSGKLNIGKRETTAESRIGIRTLELVREKDSTGTSFYFK
ncbi:MAG: glycoside hydrolase family 2 protein, partial [Bacteroidia bacterium]|nr:glycoside hydrolase family 2 protein [Bacteroidia bacterium]